MYYGESGATEDKEDCYNKDRNLPRIVRCLFVRENGALLVLVWSLTLDGSHFWLIAWDGATKLMQHVTVLADW